MKNFVIACFFILPLVLVSGSDIVFDGYFSCFREFLNLLSIHNPLIEPLHVEFRKDTLNFTIQTCQDEKQFLASISKEKLKVLGNVTECGERVYEDILRVLFSDYKLHRALVDKKKTMSKKRLQESISFYSIAPPAHPEPNDPLSIALNDLVAVTVSQMDMLDAAMDDCSALELMTKRESVIRLTTAHERVLQVISAIHTGLLNVTSDSCTSFQTIRMFKYAYLRLLAANRFYSNKHDVKPWKRIKHLEHDFQTLQGTTSLIQGNFVYTVDDRKNANTVACSSPEIGYPKVIVDMFPLGTANHDIAFLNSFVKLEAAMNSIQYAWHLQPIDSWYGLMEPLVKGLHFEALKCFTTGGIHCRLFTMNMVQMTIANMDITVTDMQEKFVVNVIDDKYFTNDSVSYGLMREVKKLLAVRKIREEDCNDDGKYDLIYAKVYARLVRLFKMAVTFAPGSFDSNSYGSIVAQLAD